MRSNQLYVSVHRLRREFDALGNGLGEALIEQRKTTRQIRLGVRDVRVRPV